MGEQVVFSGHFQDCIDSSQLWSYVMELSSEAFLILTEFFKECKKESKESTLFLVETKKGDSDEKVLSNDDIIVLPGWEETT